MGERLKGKAFDISDALLVAEPHVALPTRRLSCWTQGVVFCPTTLATGLLLAALDVFAWTSSGPSLRYVIATLWLVISFAIDGSIAGGARRLHPALVAAMVSFGAWILAVHLSAVLSGRWSSDTLVILAGALPLLVGPAIFYALPPRPQWRTAMMTGLTTASVLFAVTAVLDAVLTPWGEQPTLFGHEKAFLAVVILALPPVRSSSFTKFLTVVGLVIAFMKYPSATVGFAVLVSSVCFWLICATTRASLIFRMLILLGCSMLLLANAAEWIRQFYYLTGRGDNTDTRLGLWAQAVENVRRSPIVGSAASEPITGLANIRGVIQPVPFHNSFLSLASSAGLVALVLFILVITFAALTSLSLDGLSKSHNWVWFPAFLAGVVTMSVNPVLESLGNALPFYALLLVGSVSVMRFKEGLENTHGQS